MNRRYKYRLRTVAAVLTLSVVLCCCIVVAEGDINDQGEPVSALTAELNLDEGLYQAWRRMQTITNDIPTSTQNFLANAVAADRLRISHVLLARINTYLQNYMQTHTNQVPESLGEMPTESRTCPVTEKAFAYFPVNESNCLPTMIISTLPEPILFFDMAGGTNRLVSMLLGDGSIKDLDAVSFAPFAESNNVLRAAQNLPLMPTNLIQDLSGQ